MPYPRDGWEYWLCVTLARAAESSAVERSGARPERTERSEADDSAAREDKPAGGGAKRRPSGAERSRPAWPAKVT